MTLKTSLFNKGIYKSTVKRYLWGSIVYFIAMFVITALPILLAVNPRAQRNAYSYLPTRSPLLYDTGLILPTILITMGVSTVVGLLVYRFVHSKKTSIFTHSLPVSRNAHFISTLMAAFTLMAVPVILNGGILMVMSLTAYKTVFTPYSCGMWVALVLLTQFTFFSITSFVCMLTGNTFAAVVLNILFHGVVPILTLAFGVISDVFLFGFYDYGILFEKVNAFNFVNRMINYADNLSTCYFDKTSLFGWKTLVEILVSLLFYVVAFLLYKKRNLETAEDVAGFKVLNPVFKYFITFVGAVSVFAIFSSFIYQNPIGFAAIVIILSAVIYFAAEMLLKKTLKVYKAYKGFIGFVIVFGLLTAFFSATSVFGYETFVPQAGDIESAAIYNYYNDEEPYSKDASVIEEIIKTHKDLTKEDRIYTVRPTGEFTDYNQYHTRIHIKYNYKNGKQVNRTYYVSEKEKYDILGKMYQVGDYRKVAETLLSVKAEDVYRVNIYSRSNDIMLPADQTKEFFENVCKDLETLDYNQININGIDGTNVSFDLTGEPDDNQTYTEFEPGVYVTKYVSFNLNPNFKNTNKWLTDNEYEYFSKSNYSRDYYIVGTKVKEKIDFEKDFNNETPVFTAHSDFENGIYRLDEFTKDSVIKYMEDRMFSYNPDEEYLTVYSWSEQSGCWAEGYLTKEEVKKLPLLIVN